MTIEPDHIFPVENATYTQTTGSTHALVRDGKLYVEYRPCEFIAADTVTIDGETFTAGDIAKAVAT